MATLAAKSEWTKQIDLGLSIVDLLLKATFICNTNQERQRLSTLMKIFCEVTSARRLRRWTSQAATRDAVSDEWPHL